MEKKLTIEHVRADALKRNGIFLSEKYDGNMIKYEWQCERGHVWEASVSNIKRGRWCPYCARGNRVKAKKIGITKVQEVASRRGFKLLSTEYENNYAPLKWECGNGHIWKASYANINKGRNCPICSKKQVSEFQKDTIDNMRKIAASRGGKCLSDVYKTAKINLLWECKYGHQWKNAPTNIKKGSWCPECSSGLGERICRAYFEGLFKKKFPKKDSLG